MPDGDADCRIFLQQVIIASIAALPGISGKRRHQHRESTPFPALPDIANQVPPVALLRLQGLQLLIVVPELAEIIVSGPDVSLHDSVMSLFPEALGSEPGMGVVGNGDISLQIRGYHLSPAGVATSRRIRIVRALIRHCGVPRNEHRRAFRLLHCNRTDYRSVGDNGDVQRPVLVDLCMPSRHDVADIGHHGAGKPFPYVCPVFPAIFCPLRMEAALRPGFIRRALPGHIPPVS